MASSTLTCFQVIHLQLRSMNVSPAARTKMATSSSGRLHLLILWRFVFQLQRVQRTGSRVQAALREMQIESGLFEITMA